MKTLFDLIAGAVAALMWICFVCMLYALPVMFGAYLWKLIF